jgi:hypothetical protein
LDIGPVLVSEEPLGVRLSQASSGSSWGHLEQPGALLRAGARLKQAGATAIAVVTRFPDDSGSDALQAYRSGSGVDALAGAEAVISHLLVRELQIPCAHAPALAPLAPMADLDPRAAAEELGYTFLPCVLVGLSRAPDLCSSLEPWRPQDLAIDQVGAVVAPAGALGGETVLACADRGIPIVAVSSNPSLLQVDASVLDIPVVAAQDYAAAAGLVLAWREGLDPRALARPLSAS